MERVRSLPPEPQSDEFQIPQTTTIHGENKSPAIATTPSNTATAILQLNGTKVLFDKGFYATCVLKTKEIFRLHPEMLGYADARIMVAGALENMKLYGEALNEYLNISSSELSSKQQTVVKGKIARLRKNKD